MKIVAIAGLTIGLLFGSAAAQAAGFIITDAKIAAGKLTVQGKSPGINQTVELDAQFSVQSDASRNFTFNVVYVPADCIVRLTAGASAKNVAIANCAVGPGRGANLSGGEISVPAGYVPLGRCRQLDANIGGSKAGQAVVFSVQAPLQDGIIIYGARVPSDGHVTFNVCNFSGTTQVAIASLPVHVITFP
jgi:hypothetical protein